MSLGASDIIKCEELLHKTPEWFKFKKAENWLRQWIAAVIEDGQEPADHPKCQEHYTKFEKKVVEPLENKWTEIKTMYEKGELK